MQIGGSHRKTIVTIDIQSDIANDKGRNGPVAAIYMMYLGHLCTLFAMHARIYVRLVTCDIRRHGWYDFMALVRESIA